LIDERDPYVDVGQQLGAWFAKTTFRPDDKGTRREVVAHPYAPVDKDASTA
jgi:hypothetical protein